RTLRSSSGKQGTSRTPPCRNPNLSSACSSKSRKSGSLRSSSSTMNLFGFPPLVAVTANWPLFTSFGTSFIPPLSSSYSAPLLGFCLSPLLDVMIISVLCSFLVKSFSSIKPRMLSSLFMNMVRRLFCRGFVLCFVVWNLI
ncbi:hypothetical protein LINPERPRIM_LOCUS15467, partial [Linum perenne]